MKGKRVSKEIGTFILNAGQDTDLYCILPKENHPPVASDIRIMSTLLDMSIAKEIPGNKEEGYDPVWMYYIHIRATPLSEHSLLKVYTTAEERDREWEKSVQKWHEDNAAAERAMEKLEKMVEYSKRIC